MTTIKERYLALYEAWKDDEDMVEFLEDASNNFISYVDFVAKMEARLPRIRDRYEGQDLVNAIMAEDRARRNHHEAAIASVTGLARAARADGLEPLFDGDILDRHAIGDFCLAFVVAFFQDRDGASSGNKVHINELIGMVKRDEA